MIATLALCALIALVVVADATETAKSKDARAAVTSPAGPDQQKANPTPAKQPSTPTAATPAAPTSPAAPAKPAPAETKAAAPSSPQPTASAETKPAPATNPNPAAPAQNAANTAAASAQPAAPKKEEFELHPVERAIIDQTNAERARYGLPPLEVDVNLVQSARTHAIWMTTYQTMQHTRQPVAENIAMGQRDTNEVVNCWMNSSGHRANILSRSYRRIGAAAYRTAQGTVFWCQQFLW